MLSIGVNFPQINHPEDATNKAGGKTSNSENAWQCKGQSLTLCHRAEDDTLKVRKISTSNTTLLVPSTRRRRKASANNSTGSQRSYSSSEHVQNKNLSDEGSRTNSNSKIQSEISDGTTKINEGRTTGDDKLPKILTGEEKRKNSTRTRKNEKKRKKSQRRNQTSTVEVKKEHENEIKYGLDLTRNCIPGLDITRPYTYSYFPKIKENQKYIETEGKDRTTSRSIAKRKFLAT